MQTPPRKLSCAFHRRPLNLPPALKSLSAISIHSIVIAAIGGAQSFHYTAPNRSSFLSNPHPKFLHAMRTEARLGYHDGR
ncbi:D-amino-acid oxidase [Fusarium oxysporum f. sp. albedinis]|nr:D-amino-acid oxidase [Fusarium oxysporum f. sp. albedinis]